MLIWLNRFLYLPPRGALVVNAIYFAVVFLLVGQGQLTKAITDSLPSFLWTDKSLEKTLLILFLVSVGAAASIYGRTRKFFICARQCLPAALGTTLFLIVLYAVIWCLLQVAKNSQSFVVFQPHLWSLQGTLNNLKYGGILFLFVSAVSVIGSTAISVDSGYSFTPFLDQWKRWKVPVEKLEKKSKLEESEHKSLLNSTEEMLKELKKPGYVQPVSSASAARVAGALNKFQSWYVEQTEFHFRSCDSLEPVQGEVNTILRLC